MTTVLVVGARKNSVGAAIVQQAKDLDYLTFTAGISSEQYDMDLFNHPMEDMVQDLVSMHPTHVICTAGVNLPEPLDNWGDLTAVYEWQFRMNVIGPMRLLAAWQRALKMYEPAPGEPVHRHYVAISSNSASVPRSGSAPYCASKAALSQALRVKGREGQRLGGPIVYGYEPGLIAGTQMTEETAKQWSGAPLTRMVDKRLHGGIRAESLAWMVVANLTLGPELAGCLFRIDADEG